MSILSISISNSIHGFLTWLFLPEGYPGTVSPDYMQYQFWDTLQGFLGYLKSIILTFSFLRGLGVGNQEGSLHSAMILWICRDTTGVISGLITGIPTFTKEFSDAKQLKKWRLIAESIRILAGGIELYAAMCSHAAFVLLICVATILNTIASVISSLNRASLITHFAIDNNISDCAAKEGNQDRGVKVFGIPLAFILLQTLGENPYHASYIFALAVILQFGCNVLAVRSLKLKYE